MNVAIYISVDLEAREVRLGGRRVHLIPAPLADAFFLGHPRGPLVRMLGFEERTMLLLDAEPGEIDRRIAEAALVSPGEMPERLRVAVSLALAGGAEDAPAFNAGALIALRREGWDWRRLQESPALVVDRLIGKPTRAVAEDGWNRILFAEPAPDLEELVSGMVELLQASLGGLASVGDEDSPPETHPEASMRWPAFSARLLPVVSPVEALSTETAGTSAAARVAKMDRPPRARGVKGSTEWPESAASEKEADHGVWRSASPGPVGSLGNRQESDFPPGPSLPAMETGARSPSLAQLETAQALQEINRRAERPVSFRVLPEQSSRSAESSPGRENLPAFAPIAALPASGSRPRQLPTELSPVKTSDHLPPRSREATPPPCPATETAEVMDPPPVLSGSPASQPLLHDWLEELALELETECDLRGIDP
jgi:hypothetical protein